MNYVDLLTYFADNFLRLTVPILISIGMFLAIYLGMKLSLDKSKRAEEVKGIIRALVRGPVLVIVIGTALVLVAHYSPSVFPSYLSIRNLVFLIELILLLVSINAARKISKLAFAKFFRKTRISRRLLLIGVYALGLVALFYIILISPLRSSFFLGVVPAVSFLTGVLVTYVFAYIVNLIISRYQVPLQQKEPQLNTTITFARRVLVGVIALVGVGATAFASFPSASGAVASLFVAAGFTSIVIGLAAQSSLSNLIAGGVISTSQPFRIGDAIIYADEYCFVEDIKLMYCVLRTWDNRRIMVPNSLFLTSVIKNYTAVDESKLAIIYVQITLESDLDKAMKIMEEVVKNHPSYYPADGLPSIQVMGFTDFGVQLRALGRARDQNSNWNLEKECLYTIKKEFDRNGIKIAVPRREVVFRDGNAPPGFGD